MADQESFVLDGLELNDAVLGGVLGVREANLDPPSARYMWVGGADSEAELLVNDPLHVNREIVLKVQVQPRTTMDLALAQIVAVRDKLKMASATQGGIELVWTPATASVSATFDVFAGEITGLPINWEEGWFVKAPTMTVRLLCAPYWRGVEMGNVTDAFASNSIADYTFDAGDASYMAITGGVVDAIGPLGSENRFVHTASLYAITNAQVTLKHTLGTTVTSYKAGVVLKRVDGSNYVEAYVDDNGVNSRLRIDCVTSGGGRTNVASTNLAGRMSASTAYWIRARMEGNDVYAAHWTSAPTATGTATLSNSGTLAGGNATAVGRLVTGRAGIVWIPQQTAAALDDFEIAPNVAVSSSPFVTLEVPNVPGDVDALGRVTVTDSAGQARRHVEFGIEGPATFNSATSLLVESDNLVTSGFAGTQTTATGAYDVGGGNTTVTCTLVPGQTTAVCGTGNLSHVGSFRVKARIQSGSLSNLFRLGWRSSDGPMSRNPWVSPLSASGWSEIDLGMIQIRAAELGTQRWTGQIEVLGAATSPGVALVDYLVLVPVTEGYGVARAEYGYQPGVITGYDEFTGLAPAAVLNARSAPVGGTWASSGAAVDFAGGSDDGADAIYRSSSLTTWRYAILGSSVLTDTEVSAAVPLRYSGTVGTASLIARWVDSSNHLRLDLATVSTGLWRLRLVKVVAGVETELTTSAASATLTTSLRLIVYASGLAVGISAGNVVTIAASDSALATGGTLDDGKVGIADQGSATSSPQHYWDTFVMAVPAAEPIAIYSGRNMQIRWDETLREDSTGAYYGRPKSYRGQRVTIPVGTSRVLVKARRNDIAADGVLDDQVTDATTTQVTYQPRGLVVPR